MHDETLDDSRAAIHCIYKRSLTSSAGVRSGTGLIRADARGRCWARWADAEGRTRHRQLVPWWLPSFPRPSFNLVDAGRPNALSAAVLAAAPPPRMRPSRPGSTLGGAQPTRPRSKCQARAHDTGRTTARPSPYPEGNSSPGSRNARHVSEAVRCARPCLLGTLYASRHTSTAALRLSGPGCKYKEYPTNVCRQSQGAGDTGVRVRRTRSSLYATRPARLDDGTQTWGDRMKGAPTRHAFSGASGWTGLPGPLYSNTPPCRPCALLSSHPTLSDCTL